MAREELQNTGFTQGEAAVLIGQLGDLPPERVGGWTLIMQTRDTLDIVVMSSAISAEDGIKRSAVIEMLLDTVQKLVQELEDAG